MKKPNIINFHITDACNYTCKHCFADFKTRVTRKEMAVPEVTRAGP